MDSQYLKIFFFILLTLTGRLRETEHTIRVWKIQQSKSFWFLHLSILPLKYVGFLLKLAPLMSSQDGYCSNYPYAHTLRYNTTFLLPHFPLRKREKISPSYLSTFSECLWLELLFKLTFSGYMKWVWSLWLTRANRNLSSGEAHAWLSIWVARR